MAPESRADHRLFVWVEVVEGLDATCLDQDKVALTPAEAGKAKGMSAEDQKGVDQEWVDCASASSSTSGESTDTLERQGALETWLVSYDPPSAACQRPRTAPVGSATMPNQPFSGTSILSTRTLPPRSLALASEASTSSTAT